jgi:hypothetical protein
MLFTNNRLGITIDADSVMPTTIKSGIKSKAYRNARAGHILTNLFVKKVLMSILP